MSTNKSTKHIQSKHKKIKSKVYNKHKGEINMKKKNVKSIISKVLATAIISGGVVTSFVPSNALADGMAIRSNPMYDTTNIHQEIVNKIDINDEFISVIDKVYKVLEDSYNNGEIDNENIKTQLIDIAEKSSVNVDVDKLIEDYKESIKEFRDVISVEVTDEVSEDIEKDNEDISEETDKEDILQNLVFSSWSQKFIESSIENGIITEKLVSSVNLKDNITREEFTELLVNVYNKVVKNQLGVEPTQNKFKDTNNEAIIFANSIGLVEGVSETEFKPDSLITREQVASLVVRLEKMVLGSVAGSIDGNSFEDINEVSNWAKQDVQISKSLGYIDGALENGKLMFKPKANTTKEQALKIVTSMFDVYKDEIETEDIVSEDIEFEENCGVELEGTEIEDDCGENHKEVYNQEIQETDDGEFKVNEIVAN